MRRVRRFAALAVVASLAVGASTGSAQEQPTVLRFLDVEEGGSFVDVDGSGGFEPTVGDQFIFVDGLYAWAGTKRGNRLGSAHGISTIISRNAALITVTAVLPGGTVQVEGVQRFTAPRATLAVTGGTGRFAGARGTVTVRPLGEESGRSAILVRLLP